MKADPHSSSIGFVIADHLSFVGGCGDLLYEVSSDGHGSGSIVEAVLRSLETVNIKCASSWILAYKIDSNYAGKRHTYNHLKGNDLVRVCIHKEACENAGFKIFLGTLMDVISGNIKVAAYEVLNLGIIGAFPNICYETFKSHQRTIHHVEGRKVQALWNRRLYCT